MPSKTEYVKLSPPFARNGRIIADVAGKSGWSIGGTAIKKTPGRGEPGAEYVQRCLTNGRLVPATKSEYDAYQGARKKAAAEVDRQEKAGLGHQESSIQQLADETRAEYTDKLRTPKEEDEDFGDDSEPTEEPEEFSREELEELNKDQLKAMAAERDLDDSGKKAELIDRLLKSK